MAAERHETRRRGVIWRLSAAAALRSGELTETEGWALVAAAEKLPAAEIHGVPGGLLPGQDWTCDSCMTARRSLTCVLDSETETETRRRVRRRETEAA